MIGATLTFLVLATCGFAYRLWVGPSLADRVIALNGLLLVGMGALATAAAYTGKGAFLPTLVAISLVAPVGSAMVARFIESRGE